MRSVIASVTLGVFATLISNVSARGYYIDPVSCPGQQGNFIRQSMDKAFALARAAQESVDANINMPQGDSRVMNVLEWLFGTTVNGQIAVRNIFTELLNWNMEIEFDGALQEDDIWVFCDEDRLEVRETDGRLFNKAARAILDTDDNSKACNFEDGVPILGYTVKQADGPKVWEIQICPGLLNFGMAADPQFTADLGKPGFWAKFTQKVVIPIGQLTYKAIDSLSLFDKVMLHEITHTRAGGEKGHLTSSNQWGPGTIDLGGGFNGYGWDNCRKLAATPTNEDQGVNGPETNADTLALYAACAFLLLNKPGGNGVPMGAVFEDGSILQ